MWETTCWPDGRWWGCLKRRSWLAAVPNMFPARPVVTSQDSAETAAWRFGGITALRGQPGTDLSANRRNRSLRLPATTFVITYSPSRSNRRDGFGFSEECD